MSEVHRDTSHHQLPRGSKEEPAQAQKDAKEDHHQPHHGGCQGKAQLEIGEDHHHYHQGRGQGEDHLQHHQQADGRARERKGEEDDKAVTPACIDRMPGPILQASPGGSCPRTSKSIIIDTNTNHIEGHAPTWVPGSKEEDNKRYRDLLKYMEERRKEARELLRIEEGRKKEAKKKEESWALLRTSIAFLKEQEWKWKQRQIEEVERIKEEEKADRLAVVREKKKRYGISKLSKEENQRLKLRTEDRLTVAKAKENLWKRFRDKDMMPEMQEDEVRAWEDIQRMIIELEEEGSWRNEDKNIKDIKIRERRLKGHH